MTIFSSKQELNQVLPKLGRIMALDIGTKRIGIAICDETRFIATPKLVINRQSNLKDFAAINNFMTENQIVAIVIGLPINMDGTQSDMSKFVTNFSQNFDNFLNQKFPILLFDERLTSFEARQIASSSLSRKKEFCDDIAASLILEGFLRFD